MGKGLRYASGTVRSNLPPVTLILFEINFRFFLLYNFSNFNNLNVVNNLQDIIFRPNLILHNKGIPNFQFQIIICVINRKNYLFKLLVGHYAGEMLQWSAIALSRSRFKLWLPHASVNLQIWMGHVYLRSE